MSLKDSICFSKERKKRNVHALEVWIFSESLSGIIEFLPFTICHGKILLQLASKIYVNYRCCNHIRTCLILNLPGTSSGKTQLVHNIKLKLESTKTGQRKKRKKKNWGKHPGPYPVLISVTLQTWYCANDIRNETIQI